MRSADFVQETTTSIAGTAGDGAVTTTGIALSPRLSDAFGTAARNVRYIMQKTSTGQSEQGIGSIAANILTRTRPQVTWTGTVWADGSAGTVVPLQFGSTPTAGDVIIRLGATAEGQAAVINARQTTIAGDANWRDYPISSAALFAGNGNSSASSMSIDTEYYSAIKVDIAGLLTGIQLTLLSAGGTGMKMALYDMGPNGLPGAKIVDFAGFSTAASGLKTDSTPSAWSPALPIWMVPGWYVIGFISNGTPSPAGGAGNNCTGQTPFGRKNAYGYSSTMSITGKSYITGLPALPSMTGATLMDPGASQMSMPWIGLRIVA